MQLIEEKMVPNLVECFKACLTTDREKNVSSLRVLSTLLYGLAVIGGEFRSFAKDHVQGVVRTLGTGRIARQCWYKKGT